MARGVIWLAAVLCLSGLVGCGSKSSQPDRSPSSAPARSTADSGARADLGIDAAGLSPVITNPYMALASVKRAVYEGLEPDSETHGATKVRIEAVVLDSAETVAGIKVTVVEVSDIDEGKLAEKTRDYYAQDRSGIVYYVGEQVDDYEDGKVVGHKGQWLAGVNGARAGLFMPAVPKVGDAFDQERAPGVAEDRTTVVATGVTVTVPAGTFKNCIETEDFDPIGKTRQRKVYCRGVGLVREVFGQGRSLDLIELKTR